MSSSYSLAKRISSFLFFFAKYSFVFKYLAGVMLTDKAFIDEVFDPWEITDGDKFYLADFGTEYPP